MCLRFRGSYFGFLFQVILFVPCFFVMDLSLFLFLPRVQWVSLIVCVFFRSCPELLKSMVVFRFIVFSRISFPAIFISYAGDEFSSY